ncbi:MAG TPA: choice-of-anchor Q domain-containing protein [Tepidisphaeraceae bacterium]
MELLEIRTLLSTIYVDAGASGSTHDGTSWASAFTDLQSALAIANSGDQVDVAGGTYKPTTGADRTISFVVNTGVTLDGGFAGSASSNPDARDPATYVTVLSGDIGTVGSIQDNTYDVVNAKDGSMVDGVTITDGDAYQPEEANDGGGMNLGSATVNDCIFVDNVAPQRTSNGEGGAIFVRGYATITNCEFIGNVAQTASGQFGTGGAIGFFVGASANIINSVFIGNSAGEGGAIATSGDATITNCDFADNSATSAGGAVFGSASIYNCILWNDTAPDSSEIAINPYFPSSGDAASYSDIDGGYSGTGNINADPQFIINPDPGTDSVWGTSDDNYGNLQLQPTSPCIDAGDNADVPSGTTSDLAGSPRFIDLPTVNDTGAGTAPIVDMGAYETIPDVAAYTGGPYSVLQGQGITLNGSGLSNVSGPLQYAWDFTGNGQFTDATGESPIYTAALTTAPGMHTIALRVTNANNQSDVATTTVTVDAATVQASAGGSYTVVAGQSITLDGSGSTNVPGSLQYAWDFTGNGQFNDATGANPTYATTTQTVLGDHTVTIQVTDADGQTTTASTTVDVEAAMVQASAGGPYYVVAGKNVALSGSATTNTTGILQYAWDFSNNGQFTDATGANPSFSATNLTAGTSVPIEVQVTDSLGQTSTAQSTVTVVPANIYVDANAPGSNNGSDWENAYTTLSAALSQAVSGQTILVAGGTYYPTSTSDRTATFNLLDGVTIQGGYAGFGAANPNARRLDIFITILTGQLSSGNSYHVVTANGVDDTAVLDGVTIEDGQANGSGEDANGGGAYIFNASPVLQDCLIVQNQASGDGGGIYDVNSSPQITGGELENNTAGGNGGGIANESSSPTITSVTVKYNTASGSTGGGGGMADLDSSDPVVSKSAFGANRAPNGGAIYDQNNSAPSFTACIFASNAANGTGGDGGAFYESASSVTLVHCTIAGNSASGSGGAIYAANTVNVNLNDCIAWGDLGNGGELAGDSSQYTVSYSDIAGGYSGTGNLSNDPKFVASPSAGSDGIVGTQDDYIGDLQLLAGSPAADSGETNGNFSAMGAYAYNTDPHVYKIGVNGQTGKDEKTIEIGALVTALTSDPVKTVDIYSDTNGDLEYDAGDTLVGKAHKTKDGWIAKIPVDKLPTGKSLCFAVAESKSEAKGEDGVTVTITPPTTASISKVSAKYQAGRGKSSGTLSVAATVKSEPITQMVFAVDTNGDGTIDAGDQILYAGDEKKWKGTFTGVSGQHYSVLARVRDVNGVWSSTSMTSFAAT